MNYIIRSNGTIDIISEDISINGITPYVNERPFAAERVQAGDTEVVYSSSEMQITLSLRMENGAVVLSTEAECADGIHDIEPVGCAAVLGAGRIRFQGFGMEGPSGFRSAGTEKITSHGVIGIEGGASAMAVFAADHRRFSTAFEMQKESGLWSENTFLTAGINLECTAKGRTVLPELFFISCSDTEDCMTRAAEMISAEMKARTQMKPGFHWCSWYYHYENLDQQTIDGFLSGLNQETEKSKTGRNDPGFNYIQIDAGYTPHIGDWLCANHRYPGGLKKAAAAVISAGFEAGIWIAPFMVGDQSELYRCHPDWVLHNSDGTPYVRFRSYTEPKIWGNTDNDYYVLDLTHPDAFDYLKSVFTSFREWGFTLYKTDFILWGMQDSASVVRYDDSKTSVQVLRKTLAMIREVTGNESYLLGSIAPFMPCIGYMDGMRIASDMGAQWTEGAFGPANLLQELPYDNYFNNVFWQNDPDSVILRDFATHLTKTETRSIALLQALSGGIITTSDPVQLLSEDSRRLLDFIRPAGRVKARMPYLTDESDAIIIAHSLNDWDLLFVLNPTRKPLQVHCRLGGLFGEKALFQYRFNWNDDSVPETSEEPYFSETLAPHESALLFLTEKPMSEKPSNLWSRNDS